MENIVYNEFNRLIDLEPEVLVSLIDELNLHLNSDTSGYVYLMEYNTGYYKLGFAKDPSNRKYQLLDNEATNVGIKLIRCIKTDNMQELEKSIVGKFTGTFVGDGIWNLSQSDIDMFCSYQDYRTLGNLFKELEQIEDQESLSSILEDVITRFKEKNMKGYVYVIYVGDNLYKIGKTADLSRRFGELKEDRIVQLIRANNISEMEGLLHRKFSNKRQTASQELFRLDDKDLLYIHSFDDEWQDDDRIF